MASNTSAGTSGPTGQTMGSLVGSGATASIPAPANTTPVCCPSSGQWANPGQWSVNQAPTMEAVTWILYSYQAYPAAGATSFSFFQNAAGQGGVSAEDTNMQAAGALPSPQKFLIYGVGVDYLPGTAPIQGPRADASTSQANDFYAIMRRGIFTLTIGEKSYARIGPLMQLPPRAHFEMNPAMDSQTTPGAALQTIAADGYSAGDVWRPIPLLLEANQNFLVTVAFPNGAQTIPSADNAARIGVSLYGVLYRSPQ